ncbi:F0F1 ATP synthase subunit B [Actinoallomurus rhizosphaericola]|uniref:F0F1 ATP synthase subunit B n=1 Tax=Actinoallomurus rhizosphaericola TaxID=2952536 RepID=UPI0020903035|nr:F0F1 ATP synthase subunit B [Actinoallomurus rhizosphaericola]MCO5993944.1 F0F1 ATP synthase subunit B [Actinoallomurus rhizosphaericola]
MFLAEHAAGLLAENTKNPNPLLPDAAEMVVGIFSFLVVLFFLGKILVPRIQKALEERTDAIEGGIKRAEEAQAEAQRTLEQYQTQLAEARQEAARIREEAREQGAQIIAELRDQAQAEAQRLVDQAHTQIDADRQLAFTQLRTEIGELAIELAGRIVGESLEDEARRRGTVDRFLDELEDRARAGA